MARRGVLGEDSSASTEMVACNVLGPSEDHISVYCHSNSPNQVNTESLQNIDEWWMEDVEQHTYRTIEHGLKSSIRTLKPPMPITVKVVRTI